MTFDIDALLTTAQWNQCKPTDNQSMRFNYGNWYGYLVEYVRADNLLSFIVEWPYCDNESLQRYYNDICRHQSNDGVPRAFLAKLMFKVQDEYRPIRVSDVLTNESAYREAIFGCITRIAKNQQAGIFVSNVINMHIEIELSDEPDNLQRIDLIKVDF